MSDTLALHGSLDPQEQIIHDTLLDLRDQLMLLKQDKSTYVKSQDFLTIYDEVNKQVHLLNGLREAQMKESDQNRGRSIS